MNDESAKQTGRAKIHSRTFRSEVVDRMRETGNAWRLTGGELVLPRVFGFCRGVERALEMLETACQTPSAGGQKFFLLGQIIHNPWVNDYFSRQGVRILTEQEIADLEQIIRPADCAVIPAFGVRPDVQRRLAKIGCQIVDTSCGDVRRLWVWAQRAAREGYGVLIFGRARHDETVVTKSLLAECGGRYVIAGDLAEVRTFCDAIAGRCNSQQFREAFDSQATNADGLSPFEQLAQVSQTTMLYEETMQVRDLIRQAFAERFGARQAAERLSFQPTVCRATQDRQAAAVELCQANCDLVVVVGGYGSSNTRHLYELARQYCPAYFIEDARAIFSSDELHTTDLVTNSAVVIRNWLPARRPLRIAVLAGASTPECVVAEVLQKLAEFLAT
ncbi:MAG: 4-hydroxy-3-methylbut-2-enyl diphosphate reductase [Planctomycetaceae bacterium]|nr:MAG: 4-hydroxy-3-methylbut-2-enyl diphosphate reductase [Planctomycetaceae bacterium]